MEEIEKAHAIEEERRGKNQSVAKFVIAAPAPIAARQPATDLSRSSTSAH